MIAAYPYTRHFGKSVEELAGTFPGEPISEIRELHSVVPRGGLWNDTCNE